MSYVKCFLAILNTLGVGLCLGLLGLGVSTGFTLLTYLACGGLAVCFLGCCGLCMNNIYIHFSYAACMLAVTVMGLCYFISPATVKPIVAEALEQLYLAVYQIRSDLPCCPKIELEIPTGRESWADSKLLGVGNRLLCKSIKEFTEIPICKEVISFTMDRYGAALAICTMVLACLSGLCAGYAARILLKRRSASLTW